MLATGMVVKGCAGRAYALEASSGALQEGTDR